MYVTCARVRVIPLSHGPTNPGMTVHIGALTRVNKVLKSGSDPAQEQGQT